MATNNSLKTQINGTPQTQTKAQNLGVKALMQQDAIKSKFNEVLKDKANGFVSSVLTLVNNDNYLAQSEPMSIITGAMTAATLDLPLDKNLGYAYLVPFKDDGKQKAQFILGYKGYIQLAQRSGQYKHLNVLPVYEGELVSWNRLTEEIVYDPAKKVSNKVIGYCGYFELLNGFKKTVYWTSEEIEAHRQKNIKGNDKRRKGSWFTDYDAMAQKTVLRNLLSKWGILSIEMQNAQVRDDQVLTADINDPELEIKVVEPIVEATEEMEVPEAKAIDAETGEVIQTELI